MLPKMPESLSDDELFLPSNKSAPGLVHLHSLSDYQHAAGNSVSSDNDDGNVKTDPVHAFDLVAVGARNESDLSQTDSCLEQTLSKGRTMRQGSIVDGLLHEIYDRWHYGRNDSIDSDTLTECSSTSDIIFHSRHESGGYHSAMEHRHGSHLNRSFLQNQSK